MRLVSPYLHSLASASTDTAAVMSSRFPYRGRNSAGRGFSERSGDGEDRFVSGDSHFRVVGQANHGFRKGEGGNNLNYGGFPGQSFQPRGPSSGPIFQRRLPFHQPRQRPDDYRSWMFAVPSPPPDWERFVVVSYNILADYLAQNHRSRLYYHIPPYILNWKWRSKNIMFELGLWDPDVMCFQEVDQFQNLEEKLKEFDYRGIWKMRTGKPVDGCAIFWRCSRFNLLYEESIEFAKFGLRDNVAQICVLELKSQLSTQIGSVFHDSSSCSERTNKVVICNIHVLYNPNRGDIKLGQVRILLDRACAISRTWNDAPVVVCGDFNCTPESPLYNFISQQKLNFSGLAKNKISGQSSASINVPPLLAPNHGAQLTPNDSIRPSTLADGQNSPNLDTSSLEDLNKQHEEDNDVCFRGHLENPHLSSSVMSGTMSSDSNGSFTAAEAGNMRCISVADREKDKLNSGVDNWTTNLLEDTSLCSIKDGLYENNLSCFKEEDQSLHIDIHNVSSDSNQNSVGERSGISYGSCNTRRSHCPNNEHISVRQITNQFDDHIAGDQDISPKKSGFLLDHGDSAFSMIQKLSLIQSLGPPQELSNKEKVHELSAEIGESSFEKIGDNTPSDCLLDSDITEAENNFFHSMDQGTNSLEKTTYDPYIWTPEEITSASGSAECLSAEHPIKLKSTYTEVEGHAGTKDASGEPQVTSYNRQFMGTVDYIWCSEGLQTVKVLNTIPKHVLQRTSGYPTRKWGSDHLALACQLAFVKDTPSGEA